VDFPYFVIKYDVEFDNLLMIDGRI